MIADSAGSRPGLWGLAEISWAFAGDRTVAADSRSRWPLKNPGVEARVGYRESFEAGEEGRGNWTEHSGCCCFRG